MLPKKRFVNQITKPGFFFALCLAASVQTGFAAFVTDPFASNANHIESSWSTYSDISLNGTNRPQTSTQNGVSTPSNTSLFNMAITGDTGDGSTVLLAGGHIYSYGETLTLTLSSIISLSAGPFETVVLQMNILGNPLTAGGILLTPAGGQALAPLFTTAVSSGSGQSAATQYTFQYDLSGVAGGVHSFSVSLSGSAPSVSFANAQLDATTTVYGNNAAVPEPTASTLLGAAGLLFLFRRRCGHAALIGS